MNIVSEKETRIKQFFFFISFRVAPVGNYIIAHVRALVHVSGARNRCFLFSSVSWWLKFTVRGLSKYKKYRLHSLGNEGFTKMSTRWELIHQKERSSKLESHRFAEQSSRFRFQLQGLLIIGDYERAGSQSTANQVTLNTTKIQRRGQSTYCTTLFPYLFTSCRWSWNSQFCMIILANDILVPWNFNFFSLSSLLHMPRQTRSLVRHETEIKKKILSL